MLHFLKPIRLLLTLSSATEGLTHQLFSRKNFILSPSATYLRSVSQESPIRDILYSQMFPSVCCRLQLYTAHFLQDFSEQRMCVFHFLMCASLANNQVFKSNRLSPVWRAIDAALQESTRNKQQLI